MYWKELQYNCPNREKIRRLDQKLQYEELLQISRKVGPCSVGTQSCYQIKTLAIIFVIVASFDLEYEN